MKKSMNKLKKAFTLAEALIAMAVIGVIAAVVMPSIYVKVQEKVRSHQVSAAKIKFTKAMEMMYLNEAVGPYYGRDEHTTENFVEELKKHLKLAKICKAEDIKNCWPYEDITLVDGSKFKAEDIVTGENLQAIYDDTHDFTSNTVAIVTLDGTHMILAYNALCPALSPTQTKWAGGLEGNIATECVAAVMDVDGDKEPNAVGKDIAVLYSARGIGETCAFKIDGKCFFMAQQVTTAYTYEECMDSLASHGRDESWSKYCIDPSLQTLNYWLPMIDACGSYAKTANLPTVTKLVHSMYENINCSSYSDTSIFCTSNGSLKYIPGSGAKYGLPEPPVAQTWESKALAIQTATRGGIYACDGPGGGSDCSHMTYEGHGREVFFLYQNRAHSIRIEFDEKPSEQLYFFCLK